MCTLNCPLSVFKFSGFFLKLDYDLKKYEIFFIYKKPLIVIKLIIRYTLSGERNISGSQLVVHGNSREGPN